MEGWKKPWISLLRLKLESATSDHHLDLIMLHYKEPKHDENKVFAHE